MTTTAYSGSAARPMAGWIVFAAAMMMVIGAIDFIEGLIAVIRKHYYVVGPNQIVVFNMTTWGWLTLLWGIVLFLAGMALWSGQSWARWFAIVVCCINIIGQLLWLGSTTTPVWTLTVIALNIIVVYALTARWTGYPEAVGS
jgi:predicted membrane protein DUF2127